MAEDDIYNNKKRYDLLASDFNKLLNKASGNKYYCKNKDNIKYFSMLTNSFDIDDLSYIRRLRQLYTLKLLTYYIESDLKDIDNKTRDNLIIELRKNIKSSNLRRTERDIKRIYKVLFDENMPEPIKKLKFKVDISRQKAREDKLTYEEFDSIMKFFSHDIVIQAYLSLAFECLSRPQETLFIKIKNLEMHDNYAKIEISEHGKEGIKKLLSIDSFPYILKLYSNHENRKDRNAFLFLNEYNHQLTPFAINKKLKRACRNLGIEKCISCYSIKRFGVTFRRLNGDDDVTIQKIAGWSSTKQLKTYDLSDQEDVFKMELIKRGLIKNNNLNKKPQSKVCQYCGNLIGFSESVCSKCSHIIDRDLVKERIEKDNELIDFIKSIKELKNNNPELFDMLKEFGKEKGIC